MRLAFCLCLFQIKWDVHPATPSSWESPTCLLGLCKEKKKKRNLGRIWSLEFLWSPVKISWWERQWMHFIHSSSAPATVATWKTLPNLGRLCYCHQHVVLVGGGSLSALHPPERRPRLASPPRIPATSWTAAVTSSPSCLPFIFLIHQLFKVVFPSARCVGTRWHVSIAVPNRLAVSLATLPSFTLCCLNETIQWCYVDVTWP